MKRQLVLLLTLGFVIADPTSKQTVPTDNNKPYQTENSESEIKHDAEQKNQEVIANVDLLGDIGNQNVEVIIEEIADLPRELLPPPVESEDVVFDDNDLSIEVDEFANEIIERHPDEIMDTAAGFVPVPFIRRKKPKRKYATRRQFKRNPYRRVHYYYPYPYYPYYYPSSLRYYY